MMIESVDDGGEEGIFERSSMMDVVIG